MSADASRAGKVRRFSVRDGLGYALIAGGVWLGWEIIKAPFALRSPVSLAVRIAPTSPEVLQRAAERELVAKRADNARELSSESLARAPFNARALRVRGLAEAELGRLSLANEMLTLAGNWSLRDDPAHAWLVDYRLQRGDYGSAFAHADTLARRREDTYPAIFRLFATASTQDPRALPFVSGLLAANPPWRRAYFDFLLKDPDGAPIIGAHALALQNSRAPFTAGERQQIYETWLAERRFAGMKLIWERLRPSSADPFIQNGDFSIAADKQTQPFGWMLGMGPGINTAIVADDFDANNQAFRLQYDGFSAGVFNRQFLFLPPGSYEMVGRVRAETPRDDVPLQWQLSCADSGASLRISTSRFELKSTNWETFSASFTIPAQNCMAQWLQLAAVPGDRRTMIAAWLDDLEIRPSTQIAPADLTENRRQSPIH